MVKITRHRRLQQKIGHSIRAGKVRKNRRNRIERREENGLPAFVDEARSFDPRQVPEAEIAAWRSDPRWVPPLGLASEEDRLALARSTEDM